MKQKEKLKAFTIKISASVGSVSAEMIIPQKAKCILTLAHGAGAGMHHPFMVTLAQQLSGYGIASLRFNFPYMENKKKRPDVPAVAHQAVEAALIKAEKLVPGLPVFASGKSFGGRMTSQYLADHPQASAKGIIFYGFPLHAPGKPSIERSEHLKKIKIPMLFLQGTKDEFASWEMIQRYAHHSARQHYLKLKEPTILLKQENRIL
jgi:predicted alpha/beta-hydrolase family hydrolase